MKIACLAALFFITAGLYASVGFGGGSTYTALLVISGTDYRLVPVIALICNILVVSGNTVRYARGSLIPFKRVWSLVAASIPAAWLGGRLEISETLFIGFLWAALLFASLKLLTDRSQPLEDGSTKTVAFLSANPFYLNPVFTHPVLGGVIGFYSGLVGIGGGIFLAPLLHLMRWGTSIQIAATCSLFILLNSISGIAGQVAKLDDLSQLHEVYAYWPLIPAVIIGGLIGNYIGVTRFSGQLLKRLTGGLILFVALRLAWQWLHLVFKF